MISGVNHVTLAVSDLDRAIAFYVDVLSGTLKATWDKGAYLELGDLWLCLALEDQVTTRLDDTHIAFSTLDFEQAAAKVAQHAELWKVNTSEGNSLYFRDPDGHKLELHDGSLATRLAHYAARSDEKITLY